MLCALTKQLAKLVDPARNPITRVNAPAERRESNQLDNWLRAQVQPTFELKFELRFETIIQKRNHKQQAERFASSASRLAKKKNTKQKKLEKEKTFAPRSCTCNWILWCVPHVVVIVVAGVNLFDHVLCVFGWIVDCGRQLKPGCSRWLGARRVGQRLRAYYTPKGLGRQRNCIGSAKHGAHLSNCLSVCLPGFQWTEPRTFLILWVACSNFFFFFFLVPVSFPTQASFICQHFFHSFCLAKSSFSYELFIICCQLIGLRLGAVRVGDWARGGT